MSRNPRAGAACRPTSNPCGEGATALAAGRPSRYVKPVGKTTIPKRGPPPAPPKKLDYKRPTMTRAMEQRLKHTQKLQEEMERKERERERAAAQRRPRRTAAPVGGDARQRPTRSAEDRGGRCRPASRESRAASKAPCPPAAAASEAAPQTCPPSRQASAGVSARTRNLAKSMNADIVQAEALQAGPVDNVIIPPGAINADRTTIVSIPQPEAAARPAGAHLPSSTMHHTSGAGGAANRSMQLMSETLDEQDASEAAVVNTKLQDLQQARRDFVMAVANVGGNAINLMDDDLANVTPIADISPPMLSTPEPPVQRLYRCPSLEDPLLEIEFGRHHPVVESAREYLRGRPADRYVPNLIDHDDGCPLDDDDDFYTNLPRRNRGYPGDAFLDMNRLERFVDLQNYPAEPQSSCPAPQPSGPPRGRECLPEDLWDLDDPWYIEPDVPDLIDWSDRC